MRGEQELRDEFEKRGITKKFYLEYNSWTSMRKRCAVIKGASERILNMYAKRGISVCDRWASSSDGFRNFLHDMGLRPTIHHELDRIDSDGNYCPENCRWADIKTQSTNKGYRIKRKSYFGVHKYRDKYRVQMCIDKKVMTLARCESLNEAIKIHRETYREWHGFYPKYMPLV